MACGAARKLDAPHLYDDVNIFDNYLAILRLSAFPRMPHRPDTSSECLRENKHLLYHIDPVKCIRFVNISICSTIPCAWCYSALFQKEYAPMLTIISALNRRRVTSAALPSILLATLLTGVFFSGQASAKITKAYQNPDGTPSKELVCFDDVKKKTVVCPDALVTYDHAGYFVSSAYSADNFDEMDTLFDRWCTGKDRWTDGTWKLETYSSQMVTQFEAWQRWTDDLAKLKRWQAQKPDSFAAKYLEALYWRSYAWKARGQGSAGKVSKEGWELFRERLAKADAVLHEIQPKVTCAAWYPLRISVALDMGKNDVARAAFDEGVKRFPEYHKIYLQMKRGYEPRWGGTLEDFEAFAHESVKLTKHFEGRGMYARIYADSDNAYGVPFDPDNVPFPTWKMLKAGHDDLMKKYPTSHTNVNVYAAVACRSKDSALYRKLRTQSAEFLMGAPWVNVPVQECDLRHNWKSPKSK